MTPWGQGLFYDRQGQPITAGEWARLHVDNDYIVVAKTSFSSHTVSTVWLGMNTAWYGGPPLIFETMIFPQDGGPMGYQERYPTEAAALAGHDQAVEWLKDTLGVRNEQLP